MQKSTAILDFLTEPNNIKLNQVVNATLPHGIKGAYQQTAARYKAIIKKNPGINIFDIILNKQESSLIKNLIKNKQSILHPFKHYQAIIDTRLNHVVDQANSMEKTRALKLCNEIRILNIIKGYIACMQSTNKLEHKQKKHLLNHIEKFIDKIDLLEQSRHHLTCSSKELDILNKLIYKLQQTTNTYANEIITGNNIYTATNDFKKATHRLLVVAYYHLKLNKKSNLNKIMQRMKSIASAVARLVLPKKKYNLLTSKFVFLANIPKPIIICEDMLKHISIVIPKDRPSISILPNFIATNSATTRTQRRESKQEAPTKNQTLLLEITSKRMCFFQKTKKVYRSIASYTKKSNKSTKSIFSINRPPFLPKVKMNKANFLSMLKHPYKTRC